MIVIFNWQNVFVTKTYELTTDIQDLYAKLLQLRAQGGGDWPESVNEALHVGVTKLAWTQDPEVRRIMFLVGDAPPHMDYAQDTKYPEVLRMARERGILTVGVVTKPFDFEGRKRMRQAMEGIRFLREGVDSLITIPNQRLLSIAGNTVSDVGDVGIELDNEVWFGGTVIQGSVSAPATIADRIAGSALPSESARIAYVTPAIPHTPAASPSRPSRKLTMFMTATMKSIERGTPIHAGRSTTPRKSASLPESSSRPSSKSSSSFAYSASSSFLATSTSSPSNNSLALSRQAPKWYSSKTTRSQFTVCSHSFFGLMFPASSRPRRSWNEPK